MLLWLPSFCSTFHVVTDGEPSLCGATLLIRSVGDPRSGDTRRWIECQRRENCGCPDEAHEQPENEHHLETGFFVKQRRRCDIRLELVEHALRQLLQ